ncbi:MAG: hypothetical protein Q8O36_05545 [Candidatus Omnitrophota bacterium]|nr:hypothetical protein [Candidatus Omnitrophota bacterium]
MNLHPDKFGQAIDNDVTTHGRNRNDGVYPENSYVRCKKCGFPMNKKRHPKGVGEGNSYATATSFVREGVTIYNGADTSSVSGCPFCGTYNYD